MFEHGLHAVGSLGVFAETWLALNGHPSILGDLSELVGEAPNPTKKLKKFNTHKKKIQLLNLRQTY